MIVKENALAKFFLLNTEQDSFRLVWKSALGPAVAFGALYVMAAIAVPEDENPMLPIRNTLSGFLVTWLVTFPTTLMNGCVHVKNERMLSTWERGSLSNADILFGLNPKISSVHCMKNPIICVVSLAIAAIPTSFVLPLVAGIFFVTSIVSLIILVFFFVSQLIAGRLTQGMLIRI